MLARKNRIVKEKDFERLYKQGKRASAGDLRIIILRTGQNVTRFGFVISKKQAGRVVERNKIKRRLRAVVRKLTDRIKPGYDVLLSAKKAVLETRPAELEKQAEKLLRKTGIIDKT